jgi:transposase
MERQYSKELKIEICKMIMENGIKHEAIANRFGMNKSILYRWVDEYKAYGNEAFVGKGQMRPDDAKLKKLEKENERLKMEVEILKKAAAYFANEKTNG